MKEKKQVVASSKQKISVIKKKRGKDGESVAVCLFDVLEVGGRK